MMTGQPDGAPNRPYDGLRVTLPLAPPAASPMRRCLCRVHVPVGSAYGCANQAIGPRCPLLAWAFGPRKLRATGQRRIRLNKT